MMRKALNHAARALRLRIWMTRKYHNRSKYAPHQGEREKARRVRQMERQS